MIGDVIVLLFLSGGAVLIPEGHNLPPGGDYLGGPMNGVMAELRDEKRNLPTPTDLRAVEGIIAVGRGDTHVSIDRYAVSDATQSYTSTIRSSWFGKIEAGFLAKWADCSRTNPWLDQQSPEETRVHFYWSCDRENPFLIRTDITLASGKVTSWTATDFQLIPVLRSGGGANR